MPQTRDSSATGTSPAGAAPRLAATVVLLRQGDGGRPAVFLLKRHGASPFMAGAHVFPGGSLDAADGSAPVLRACVLPAAQAAARLDGELGPDTALALHVCALRETFEEAGLFLGAGGNTHLLALRRELLEKSRGFPDIVAAESLRLEPELLAYFAHWITPEFQPKRYDTRFFAALAPPGQQAWHDAVETTDSAWWTPRDALARATRGEIFLAPPTYVILEAIAHFDSPEAAVYALAATPRPVPVMLPRLLSAAPRIELVLPGDPDYGPGGRHPSPGEPIRVALAGSAWQVVRA